MFLGYTKISPSIGGVMNIKNNVTWVGSQDFFVKKFHGDAYDTPLGTSYNAYLIQEEKTVLIDTVAQGFAVDFINNLENIIDLKSIDYIVIQHGEIDHSGALPLLMEKIPNTPIYCTEECMYTLKGHYHKAYNFQLVKTGDTLTIGHGKELFFIEMKMLHWPDSMATYLSGDHILFSNDVFGQHTATENMFVDKELYKSTMYEAQKYYANILTPFSKMMKAKLKQIIDYHFTIEMIAPSHGLVWKENVKNIMQAYDRWSSMYSEDYIVIFYDTMWKGTKDLAINIADGIRAEDPAFIVEVMSIRGHSDNDLMHAIFKSKMFLIGSPTINNGFMPSVASLLNQISGLRFKGKKAAVFGCYGWSGEAPKQIKEHLQHAGVQVMEKELTSLWRPSDEKIYQAQQFGKLVAKKARA